MDQGLILTIPPKSTLSQQGLNFTCDFDDTFAGCLHPVRCHPVVWLALFVKETEVFGVGEERARWIVLAEAAAQFVEWSVEIDDANTGSFEQGTVCRLNEGSATERDDRWIAIVESVKQLCERFGFKLTEPGFPGFTKDVGHGAPAPCFDLAVEIDETPPQALGQRNAYGGFAGAHETNEEHSTGSMGVAASDGLRLDHRSPRDDRRGTGTYST
ncbi:MAG TPA: hypothetical protein VFU86_08025 [Terriglobales bacterium]|nr:hypothetical protein [Terriglobales bacterium]